MQQRRQVARTLEYVLSDREGCSCTHRGEPPAPHRQSHWGTTQACWHRLPAVLTSELARHPASVRASRRTTRKMHFPPDKIKWGYVVITIVSEIDFLQYAPHLCHLLPVGDTIATLPLAQPVAKTFRDAFSYWVSKLRYDGSLDSLAYRSLHRNIQRRRACGALGAGITPSGFGYQDLSDPFPF